MQLVHSIPVVRSLPAPGGYMCGLTFDGTHLWYSDQDAERIWAIDPTDGTVVRELVCPWVRADLTYHDGQLCQVGGRPKRIVRIDPATGAVLGHQPVRPSNGRLCGVETGPDGMWMCLRAPAVLQLRDLASMEVKRQLPVEGGPSGLTYVDGTVLYGEFDTGVVRAVDAETGELLVTVTVEGHPTGMAWDGTHVWYCDFASRSFKAFRLDDLWSAGRS